MCDDVCEQHKTSSNDSTVDFRRPNFIDDIKYERNNRVEKVYVNFTVYVLCAWVCALFSDAMPLTAERYSHIFTRI